MARKFDIVVYGDGIAALSAAWKAAKAGHAVLRLALGTKANDDMLSIDAAAFGAICGHAELDAAKVIEHRFWFLSDNAGSQMSYRDGERADAPAQWLMPRSAFCEWLQKQGETAGVTTESGAKIEGLMLDRSEHLQAVQLDGGEVVRCRAVVLGDGGEGLAKAEICANDGPDPRSIIRATQKLTLDADVLAARLCLDDGEAVSGAIFGDFCGGRPSRAWLKSDGKSIELGLQSIAGPYDEEGEANAKSALGEIAKHPSIAPLLKGASAGAVLTSQTRITGYKDLPNLFGNGWLLTGSAARLSDPLRGESVANELQAGACAADAISRCFKAGETGARAMGVYYQLLEDSFVVQNLKAQRNAVEDLEKDPSLMSFYSDFFNKWFGHDTEASLEPRKARNKNFFKTLRNERPVWEFAMGMRKGLKLLRD